MPLGLLLSTEYVIAARYGAHLSEVMAEVVSPFLLLPTRDGLLDTAEEIPTRAVFVAEETEPAQVESGFLAQQLKGSKKRGKVETDSQTRPKALPAIYIKAQTVLRIANSGRRPTGKSVTAEGQRPAGVQVFGASSLGVGVRDGDIITRVSGVPVTSANQIVSLIIAARGARQSAISGQVYRGQRSYTLTVEQPYLPAPSEPAKADAGVQSMQGS